MRFEVLMKPVGMSKRTTRRCPEYLANVEAADANEAAAIARQAAAIEGFNNYAVTKIKEARE
jgi:hypothetical protein